MFKLRDYQREALTSVITSFNAGINKQLIVLPTGSGKTVIIAAILDHFKKKSLVISHRKEIINQTIKTIGSYTKSEVGSFHGDKKDLSKNYVVGSIQSCSSLTSSGKLLSQDFEVLIIDEAHHSCAKSYRGLINNHGFDTDKNKLLIGVTATPDLSNGNSLGEVYDKISYCRQITYMIENNHLSDIYGRKIRTSFNLDGVAIKNGDYEKRSLSEVINKNSRNKIIVEKYKEYVKDSGKALTFCSSIDHAKKLSKAFADGGITSSPIYGYMKLKDRVRILKDFRDGKIEVLNSVSILIEGFDMPSINTIVMARPTKSKSLYIQMAGRGLRKYTDKKRCLVLDFIDEDHNLKQPITLNIAVPECIYEVEPRIGDCSRIPMDKLEYDLSDSVRKVVDVELNLLGKEEEKSVAEIKLSKTTQDGLITALGKGIWISVTPIGYKKYFYQDGRKTIVECKEGSAVVRYIFDLYVSGDFSIGQIKDLVKSKFNKSLASSGVARVLSNKFYIGYMQSKHGLFTHNYGAIIDKSLFEAVQEVKKKRLGRTGMIIGKKKVSFKKLIRCSICGCFLTGDVKKLKHVYYRCTQSKYKHNAVTIKEEAILARIISDIENITIAEEKLDVVADHFKKNYKYLNIEKDKVKLFLNSLKLRLPEKLAMAKPEEMSKLINIVYEGIEFNGIDLLFNRRSIFK